ncbi:GDP-mannose 4,6-dehydratase [Candidatus Woesearchaeota archaeon]|jgi:GDPmannose 4,6-dehydratase|nr:GDP-mannose 4,6-dehydratase [Candidatus Woesearchaeota archaeon]
MKRALITGITGQDGPYLARLLLSKGYKVYGTYRRTSSPNFWRLQHLGILKKITLIPADLSDMSSLLEAVTVSNPDEIYNLAAQSFVGASFDQPLHTTEIDASGATRFLEIIRHLNKNIKFYQASTSELFGGAKECPQDERTPMMPNSPYAAAKLHAYHMTKIYRHSYGIFTCNGILFNHESPLRGLEFVTRKITNSVAKIKLGLQKELVLGNLDAKRDWGYAGDFVKMMWMMMQHDKPDDFVIATGETHSVGEFAEEAFKVVGLDWKKYVKSDQKLHRPMEVHQLCGDARKARDVLGWEAEIKFKELVKMMVESDLRLWKKFTSGENFPWDAPSFPHGMDVIARNVTRDASREAAAGRGNKIAGMKKKKSTWKKLLKG